MVIEEGRLLAKVRHDNIVTVHGAERIDERVGVWMELVRGRTLEEELIVRGPFPPEEVAAIGIDVCRALAAVHRAGLIHRDVKAQNVMREPEGRVVLMDFGTGLDRADSTETTGLAGTPLYLAPEVIEGGAATVQSDLYSVGVLLYRLATGDFPIEGRTLRDVRREHAEGTRTKAGGITVGPSSWPHECDRSRAVSGAVRQIRRCDGNGPGTGTTQDGRAARAQALAHAHRTGCGYFARPRGRRLARLDGPSIRTASSLGCSRNPRTRC